MNTRKNHPKKTQKSRPVDLHLSLEESEQRFRAIVQNSLAGYFFIDADGIIRDVNDAWLKMYGFTSRDEIIGQHFRIIQREEDVERAIDVVDRIMKGETNSLTGEFSRKRRDGTNGYHTFSAWPVIKEGKTVGIEGFIIDSTSPKHAEKELSEFATHYQELADSIADVFFAMDKNLKYIHWNKASEKLTGIEAKDAIGKSLFEIFPQVKGTDIETMYLDVLRTQQPLGKMHAFQLHGEYRHYEINAYPSRHGLSVFVRDVTDRRQMEELLEKSETQYRAIVEDQTELICRYLPDGTILFVNQAYCRYFGKEPEELVGRTFFPLILEQDRNKVHDQIAMLTPESPTLRIEQRVVRADGQICWQQWTSRLIVDEQNQVKEIQSVGRDISERKQAEEVLKESEEKFRYIFQNAPGGMLLLNPDGSFLQVNRSLCNMLGYTEEELKSMTFRDMTHPDDLDASNEWVRQLLDNEETYIDFEKRYIHKKGDVVWGIVRAFLKRDHDGAPLYFITHVTDITARRRTEIALRENEQQLSLIFESVSDVLFYLVVEPEDRFRFVSVNKVFLQATGLEEEQIIGKDFREVIPPQAHELVLGKYHEAIRENRTVYWEEISVYPVGKKYGEVTVTPIFDANGNCTHLVGTVHDVTDRKQAEELVRESELHYRTLFENSLDAILLTVPDGSILSANPAACRMLGLTEEDICQKGRDSVIDTSDPRLQAALEERARTGRFRGELTFIRKNGSRFPGELSSVVFQDQEGQDRTSMIIRDITERKQSEQLLQDKIRELERFNKVMIGRELKMIELKKEIKRLKDEGRKT